MKYKNYLSKIVLFLIAIFSINIIAQDSTKAAKDTSQLYSYSTVFELNQQLDDIFNDNSFRNANWGVVIQSL